MASLCRSLDEKVGRKIKWLPGREWGGRWRSSNCERTVRQYSLGRL